MNVLDLGFVKTRGVLASDLDVVNAARVSYDSSSKAMGDREIGIINFMIREKHGSPFEHNLFRFHVKAPLFVRSQWERHRIGWSYNEQCGRYTTFEKAFYVPSKARKTMPGSKPGQYKFEPMPGFESDVVTSMIFGNGEDAWARYEGMLSMGAAKEQARLVLPQNLYTQFWASCNARSLMKFLELRNDDEAMYEIREYAKAIEKSFAKHMPVTHDAFVANGRIAP